MNTEKYSRILAYAVVGTLVAMILATLLATTYALIIKPILNM